MLLADRVSVARRFQRAVRIDTDLADLTSLEGFVCTQSSATVLEDYGPACSRDPTRGIHLDGPLRQR